MGFVHRPTLHVKTASYQSVSIRTLATKWVFRAVGIVVGDRDKEGTETEDICRTSPLQL
jgi:hypothetical protein